jgi:hypothetical protein
VSYEPLRRAQRRHPDITPTRQTLAVAVRRVGTATGRPQTVAHLHELAVEAQAWAAVLDVTPVEVRR